MAMVLRADEAPAKSRVADWCDRIAGIIGPHEVRAPCGIDAGDRLVVFDVGPVLVGDMSSGRPVWVHRSRRNILRSDSEDDLCKVHVMARGRGVVRQDGREADLGSGDLAFVDLSRPAHWDMSPMRCVVIGFPRRLLPLDANDTARLTAVRVRGDRGVGRLASSLARQLPRQLDDGGTASAANTSRLGTAVLDLLTVALASQIGGGDDVPAETQRRALLVRIRAFIEERLSDPGLSPAVIAAAHHMSVRSLYKLFEDEETTVASWIRRRRLERCRRDLLDPGQRTVPVSTIGARWGLTNAAHFSRVFRAVYGMAPVDYRRMAEDGLGR
jgi:AraC-like DNA-binding protein